MDLGALSQSIKSQSQTKLPPVEKWDPPFCGDMDLCIKTNGEWWHEGSPFTRQALVKLFASVLKKEDDKYFLVTPVEKIGIQVQDVPFVICDWHIDQQGRMVLSTQVGDELVLSEDNPIELRTFQGISVPYCLVRRNLWARVHQNVLYQWVNDESLHHANDQNLLIIGGANYQFSLGEM